MEIDPKAPVSNQVIQDQEKMAQTSSSHQQPLTQPIIGQIIQNGQIVHFGIP